MSKQVKQMQMDVLAKQFADVKDMVILSASGIDVQSENAMRLNLRKKNIRLQMVKNSLFRRVYSGASALPESTWSGSTVIAWGGDSIKGLSKEIETYLKDAKLKDKLTVKTAFTEGQTLPFAQALLMPTRLEAIGEIVAMIAGPGSAIASAIGAPGSQIASQIKTIAEKSPEGEAAPAA